MKKRGAVEVQFNWIFVFVAGSLMLLFIVGFVTTQRQRAEESLAYRVLRDTSTLIAQAGVASGKSDLLILNKPLRFDCDSMSCTEHGCSSGFSVDDTRIRWETPIRVIFSPDMIRGRKLITWSLDWGVPYRVVNFIYLSTPEIRYVFIGSPDEPIAELYNELPKSVDKELVSDPSSIINKNNYKVKMVYYESDPGSVPPAIRGKTQEVTAINILPDSSGDNTGIIRFYEQGDLRSTFVEVGEANYLGTPSIHGAIFSNDLEIYECNMKKALLRLNKVSSVYREKVLNLLVTPLADSCEYSQDSVVSIIENSADLDLNSLDAIDQEIKALKIDNTRLKIYSCPLIY
jgi:hypothetical protein